MGALLIVLLSAFSTNDIFDDIVRVMQSGKAEQLTPYLSEKTDVQFPGESASIRNPQEATAVLRKFMTTNPVRSVEIQHRGPAGKNSFVIAKYQSTNGKTFRVTIFVDTTEKRIKELKFENS